ncbi:hypothetical protein DRN74_06485 [Candidatus Micrarchaeota archaeon]|nr:MAG: hypothetical protein DRN74_06485 [Candidatus Micrarchaeota archaeon]
MKNEVKIITITVDLQTWKALKHKCIEESTTVSALLRPLIKKVVEDDQFFRTLKELSRSTN